MKTIFASLTLLAVFCGCASAEPPDHKPVTPVPTNAVMVMQAPVSGPPVTGVTFYGANHADTAWTPLQTSDCTNGAYMQATVPVFDEYTGTSTNKQTGQSSDYAPKILFPTNAPALNPPANTTVTPN